MLNKIIDKTMSAKEAIGSPLTGFPDLFQKAAAKEKSHFSWVQFIIIYGPTSRSETCKKNRMWFWKF